jgi:hypothetical protein
MGGPEAIELTDADEQTKALVECLLHYMAGRMGSASAELKHPLAHFASELERMPMPPIVQRGQWICLETLSQPINGDWMERESGSLVGLLH